MIPRWATDAAAETKVKAAKLTEGISLHSQWSLARSKAKNISTFTPNKSPLVVKTGEITFGLGSFVKNHYCSKNTPGH